MWETIIISLKEYKRLLIDSFTYNLLSNSGVDNWNGWDQCDWDSLEKFEDSLKELKSN